VLARATLQSPPDDPLASTHPDPTPMAGQQRPDSPNSDKSHGKTQEH
jgi:hypothetical protein